ncbi:MAG: Crp/Fnr family transcriptional regulator [Bdellovibrio sp.]|nr:Crp/Fnr family transcriptional regulator [Bdellovibrio sp.]
MSTRQEIPSHCKECNTYKKSLFCDIANEPLDCISKSKVTNFYKKGTTLFFEGTPNYGLFEVCSGKIKISKLTSNGSCTIVDIATSGDTIGLSSILEQQLYTTSAEAVEDSVVCFFDKNFFTTTVLKERPVVINIIDRLSREIHNSTNRISSLSQKNVREKLAELILSLSENYGKIEGEGNNQKLDILLSRDEMASMIGVAKETLIRTLSDFKDEGLISQKGKYLYLQNRTKLNQYANLQY